MFGTAASLAGIQNSVKASIRNWATNSQIRLSTIGIEAKSPNRMMSTTTIVLRRSNRSANAPAKGPRTIAGSNRNSSTPPSAKLAAVKPSTSEGAGAGVGSRPSQSPKLDRDIESQSRRKSRTRRTARSLATRPTAPSTSADAPRSSSGGGAGGVVSERIGTPGGQRTGLRVPRRPHGTGQIRRLQPFHPPTTGSGGQPTDH